MTMTTAPWLHPRPEVSQLHLDVVPPAVLHALAAGELDSATTEYLSQIGNRSLWQMRSRQILATPEDAPWITRFMVVPHVTRPVGAAGFHGAPDDAGMAEIGYRVDPAMRRRGYARRSVETLLAVAQHHPGVHTVRATVSPDNAPSRSLVESFGFAETGEQWDDEDGLEIIYEISA
nr:GNAT family N-acetyltransferase [Rhodococcus sp. (in: high G+C Gram-positive bacteria)]